MRSAASCSLRRSRRSECDSSQRDLWQAVTWRLSYINSKRQHERRLRKPDRATRLRLIPMRRTLR